MVTVVSWLAWLACAGAPSPPPSAPPERPDLVLIVWETTRADHLSVYGYAQRTTPNLELLAQQAVRFDAHTATAPWTRPSVVSLLSGLHPTAHGVRELEDALSPQVPMLAEELRAEGYHTALIASNAFFEQEPGLRRGFDWYHGVDATPATVLATDVLAWLDQRPTDRPSFLYVHLYDPHCPYTPPDALERMFWPMPPGLRRGARYTRDRWQQLNGCFQLPWDQAHAEPELELDIYRAAWQAEVHATDHATGVIVERLRAAGVLDRALVVVTADHGEEFLDHGGTGHGGTLYEEVLRVPLLVRPPGGLPSGRVVSTPTSGVDVTATLRGAAGLPAPLGAAGLDLSVAWTGGSLPADRIVYAETDAEGSHLRMARQGEHKLVVDLARRHGALRDLATVPGEVQERGPEAAVTRAALGQALGEHLRRSTGVAGQRERIRRPLDQQTTEALVRMGYLD